MIVIPIPGKYNIWVKYILLSLFILIVPLSLRAQSPSFSRVIAPNAGIWSIYPEDMTANGNGILLKIQISLTDWRYYVWESDGTTATVSLITPVANPYTNTIDFEFGYKPVLVSGSNVFWKYSFYGSTTVECPVFIFCTTNYLTESFYLHKKDNIELLMETFSGEIFNSNRPNEIDFAGEDISSVNGEWAVVPWKIRSFLDPSDENCQLSGSDTCFLYEPGQFGKILQLNESGQIIGERDITLPSSFVVWPVDATHGYGPIFTSISSDGKIVVGNYLYWDTDPVGFIWNDGTTIIPELPFDYIRMLTSSNDGKVIFAHAKNGDSNYIIKMNPLGQTIGTPIEIDTDYPLLSTNDDGSIAVVSLGMVPMILKEDENVLLTDKMTELGIMPNGWNMDGAVITAMSVDGTVMTGRAQNNEGKRHVFRVVIPKDSLSNIYYVNSSDDVSDPDLEDGICDAEPDENEKKCTLRAAIESANAYDFDERVPVIIIKSDELESNLINVLSPLPPINRSVTIKVEGSGIAEVRGIDLPLASHGFEIKSDSVSIHGLAITGFPGYGIDITDSKEIKLTGNKIGYDLNGTPLPNSDGGIRISGLSSDITIGGSGTPDDENQIYKGVVTIGDQIQGIRLLKNTIELTPEQASGFDLRSLFDLNGDGPSCGTWERDGNGPNGNIAPPRVLELTGSIVRGISTPGDTVVVYKVTEAGTGNGRYWPRKVEPITIVAADENGSFMASVDLEPGDILSLTAMDASGNTSEFSQLRRPVVFLPGIGGTWLRDQEGTKLWLPLTPGDNKNNRMVRLAMQSDGKTSIESLVANEVIEEVGTRMIYGPIHDHLDSAGFPGHKFNENPETLDQYRFPNDWRRSADVLADSLRIFMEWLVDNSGEEGKPARACQADLIAHSNGGMISSVYLRRDQQHASNRINKFITSGTPYLGSTQAVAAHTNGYIFGLDEKLKFVSITLGWNVAWGDMLAMVRNIPGAYGLMPSRKWYEAIDRSKYSHGHGYSTVDLYNEPVVGYDATFDFMTRSKVNVDQIPTGLARNASIWEQQQNLVHDVMNDWRTYEGPPHIFRHVGYLISTSETGWYMGPGRDQMPVSETSRSESDDTDRHRAFRERLRPIMGHGDETVPLVSATLGRHKNVGKTDFSGVDESEWIEEFEYFSCAHGDLVEEDCLPLPSGGKQALDRILDIIISGHQVLPDDDMQKNQMIDNLADEILMNREVFYVHGDAPIRVIITDSEGFKTGPTDPENPGAIERSIPDIYYRASILGAVMSVPSGRAYTIEAVTLEAESRVFITRQQAGEENLVQILYPDQSLIAGSSLSFNLEPGGTLEDQPWRLDLDGDGLPDLSITPAVVLPATSSVPALPVPQPSNVIAGVPSGGTITTRTLQIPDTGTQGWSYSLSGGTSWLEITSGSGSIPATIDLLFDATGLSNGDFTTTLDLTLQNGEYSTELTVPVTFTVGITVGIEKLEPEEIPDQFRLWAAYPNPFNPSTTITYDLVEPVHVQLTVYDIMGRKITTLVDQQLAAGRHTAVFEAGNLSSGTYIYRIEAGNITQMMKMMLLK